MSDRTSVEKDVSDKRAAILEATLTLISERGFHNTPMSLIAKTSGVSAGIIYHYFSGKEELINELYKEIKLETIRAMLAGCSEDLSLNEQFLGMWANYIHYSLNHPTKSSFLEQFENSPLAKHVIDEDIIWDAVKNKLPELKDKINEILGHISNDTSELPGISKGIEGLNSKFDLFSQSLIRILLSKKSIISG